MLYIVACKSYWSSIICISSLTLSSFPFALLSAIFSGKKKTLSSIFAGLSIAGALANLALVFSGKCCCKKLAVADDFDDLDDEELDDSDIFCDFENDADGCDFENTTDNTNEADDGEEPAAE